MSVKNNAMLHTTMSGVNTHVLLFERERGRICVCVCGSLALSLCIQLNTLFERLVSATLSLSQNPQMCVRCSASKLGLASEIGCVGVVC